MTTISEAITAINPSAEFSVNAEDFNQITWLNGTATISRADIEAKQAELQTAREAAELQKATDKASAKAKLIAGEALTEAEADTIVL
jgi:hypothetical protein